MTALLTLLVVVAAVGLAGWRWLRVAQVEHYLAGSVTQVASRWWTTSVLNVILATAAFAALGLGTIGGFVGMGIIVAGPAGLPLRGRTSKLRPTRRLQTVGVKWVALSAGSVVFLTAGAGLPLAMSGAIVTMGAPVLVDGALWLLAPIENFVSARWARRAGDRLAGVAPTVVAITGSYGKTTTKTLVVHLLAASRSVVASPASWNNRAGLAKTVNEQLVPGTEVFVAEMGTYGPGEIADLCRWFPPDIAVITAIGPVHLERFGSLDRTLAAKAEIIPGAAHVVLNVDDERLSLLAERLAVEEDSPAADSGRRVWRCSAEDAAADVAVIAAEDADECRLLIGGRQLVRLAAVEAAPTNLACAVAVALACGVQEQTIVAHLALPLPVADHRLSRSTGANGFGIIDDTFNANPAGAVRALAALGAAEGEGRLVVVTPGMVELGPLQDEANEALAAAASDVASELVIVGRTNRRALQRGARSAGLATQTVATREAAVDWVKANLGPGDTVLYENDLPDTYP